MRNPIKAILAAAILSCFLTAPPALAQFPAELEGPVSAVVDNGNGTGTITVMGITVQIPSTATIHSPTATLTISQLASTDLLPGRSSPGFIGGTGIIIGTTDGVTTTASDVFVEPAENVVVGLITAAGCSTADCSAPGDFLHILGSPLVRLTDPRMPAEPPANAFGFEIDMRQGGLVGSAASVEGYFGQTVPALHYFILELDGGVLANAGLPEVSILRAQCRERDDGIELQVLGATHDPATAVVTISNTDSPGEVFGVITAVTDADNPIFGTYDFELEGNPAFSTCPTSVTAEISGAVPAVSDVDVRTDVPAIPPGPLAPAPPVAGDDSATTTINTPVNIPVLANDTDLNGDVLAVQSVASPTANGGAATISGASIVYTPAAGFTGVDTFTYTVSDGNGGIDTALVTVNVSATPPISGEVVTIRRATFANRRGNWIIRGTSTVPGVSVTAVLDRTGETIASFQARPRGRNWVIRARGSAVNAQPGDTITVTTSNSGIGTASVLVRP